MKQYIKDLLLPILPFLKTIIPIYIMSLLMGFVRAITIKDKESVYTKILQFFASSLFGSAIGYIITLRNVDIAWVYTGTSLATLLAIQIINYIDRVGLKELITFAKNKIPGNNSPTDNTNPPDAK